MNKQHNAEPMRQMTTGLNTKPIERDIEQNDCLIST